VVQADKGLAQAPLEPRTHTSLAYVDDYDDFFDRTYPLLLKVALASGANIEEAEDAVDETMAYLYRRWGEIAEPRAYARKAVINAVAKAKKRDGERFDRTVAGGHVTPEADDGRALIIWEGQQWVLQHLSALPPAQQEMMAGVFDEMSTAEIAATLGKTEATVRKNLPKPALPHQLGADEPPRKPMATTRPRDASLPGNALCRQNPRQEPSAVIPHAGICAGPPARAVHTAIDRCTAELDFEETSRRRRRRRGAWLGFIVPAVAAGRLRLLRAAWRPLYGPHQGRSSDEGGYQR
jgi:RNA polymerase sigma factor (sigma-70 family)